MDLENLNPYDRWQLEKYGNILPPVKSIPDERVIENGFDDINRFSEWMLETAERDLLRMEEQHACKQDLNL